MPLPLVLSALGHERPRRAYGFVSENRGPTHCFDDSSSATTEPSGDAML
jgi:hypothetical protein